MLRNLGESKISKDENVPNKTTAWNVCAADADVSIFGRPKTKLSKKIVPDKRTAGDRFWRAGYCTKLPNVTN
jgi:hypothetical protein